MNAGATNLAGTVSANQSWIFMIDVLQVPDYRAFGIADQRANSRALLLAPVRQAAPPELRPNRHQSPRAGPPFIGQCDKACDASLTVPAPAPRPGQHDQNASDRQR